MAVSQNGYTANNRDYIATYTVPGTSVRLPIRKGDVSVVLLYVAEQFHKRVEPLTDGWNWGYAERPVRGGVSLSNHASGTAIDLNAPKHPLGKRNTFSAAQVRVLRQILAEVGGVVRWGGDYVSRADDMHFEIIAGSAAVAAVANRLRAPVVGPPPAPRSLRNLVLTVDGQLGPATIAKLQWMIGHNHQNGQLGRDTVRTLQSYLGVTRDGLLGPVTIAALQKVAGAPTTNGQLGRDTVRAIQRWLNP